MIRSFKIRIYPTKEQEQKMWNHIGACRFIWNYMLNVQKTIYENGEKHLSAYDMIKLLKPLKNDGSHEWLQEVSYTSLQTICRDLDKAYKKLFQHKAKMPKFKSKKKSKPSYPVRYNRFYFEDEKLLNIEKIGKVKYKTDRVFPFGRGVKFTNPRVLYESGKWFISFGMECERQVRELTDKSMGVDVGIKELAIVAFDAEKIVYHNINKSSKIRHLEKRKVQIERSISRKYQANKVGNKYVKTKNIVKQEEKLRKVYDRLKGIRRNYTHQTTHALVSLLPKRIVMEDLNVSGMMKNKHLSKAIQEQCFYEFKRQIQYKCEDYGIKFVPADRFFPSSKMCSKCGAIKHDLKLSDRTYVCEECGNVIDRDFNAALNLSRYVA